MPSSRWSPDCLLAVAAGALALALSRVLLFLAGGAACVSLAHAVAPSFDEPAVCFLVGGLLGVLLYKVWVTALSSLAGTLLIAYSILGVLSKLHLATWSPGRTSKRPCSTGPAGRPPCWACWPRFCWSAGGSAGNVRRPPPTKRRKNWPANRRRPRRPRRPSRSWWEWAQKGGQRAA